MRIPYNGYKQIVYTLMTTKTTTTALILMIFALVGGAIISTVVVPTPVVYAQLSDIDDIVDDSLDTVGIIEEEEEEAEEDSNIEQESVDQEVGQGGISQSKDFDGTSTDIQIQTVDERDAAHEIVNNNDFSESSSEFGYAKGKYSSFTYSSTDAEKANEQDADNEGELTLDEEQTVDQDDTSIFADDASDLHPANVATSIAMPVYLQVQEEIEEES